VTGDGGFAPDGAPISINGSSTPFAMAGVRAAEIPDLAMSHLGVILGPSPMSAQRPDYPGDLNRSTQHLLILLDKEVADGDVTDIVHGEAEE
jgi:hypothetical protein